MCLICSPGNLSKTCTEDGWTPVSIETYIMDCGYNPNITVDDNVVSMAAGVTKPPQPHVAAAAASCSAPDDVLHCLFN